MASRSQIVAFASAAAMAERVADLVESVLARGLCERGAASLALSGGATPERLYPVLADRRLGWDRVTATLVDERFVAPGEAGSNEAFLRRTFLRNDAARARFVGLWTANCALDEGAAAAAARVSEIAKPFDAVILGMGADGHSASWFPDAEGLAAALSPGAPAIVPIRAKASAAAGAWLERLTLSLDFVAHARLVVLLLSGAEKRAAYDRANADGPVGQAPVRAILRARPDMWVCWTP